MLYHICTSADWHTAQQRGEYRADSLSTEGFIHASTGPQVVKTADRFYRGQGGLVLLAFNETLLHAEVRYEAADGDQFPHVYGPINLGAVSAVFPFLPSADGTFRMPPEVEAMGARERGRPELSTLIERLAKRAHDPKRATDEGQGAARGTQSLPNEPVTPTQIAAAEAALGFPLPPLLERLYQEVADGGFGPGDGLPRLSAGTEAAESLTGRYAALRRENLAWPDGLIPLCAWGSGIASYADCSRPDAPVVRVDPNMPRSDVAARVPAARHYDRSASVEAACWTESPSLEAWLAAWADGGLLFYAAYGGTDGDASEDDEEADDGDEDDAV